MTLSKTLQMEMIVPEIGSRGRRIFRHSFYPAVLIIVLTLIHLSFLKLITAAQLSYFGFVLFFFLLILEKLVPQNANLSISKAHVKTDILHLLVLLVIFIYPGYGNKIVYYTVKYTAYLVSYLGFQSHTRAFLAQLNPWVGFFLALILVEFGTYWCHRLLLHSNWWRAHRCHHSSPAVYTMMIPRQHIFDTFVMNASYAVMLTIFGFEMTVVIASNLFVFVCSQMGHNNVDYRSDWLQKFLLTNHVHRIHHAKDGEKLNYGVCHFLWDHVFGTYYCPPQGQMPAEYGLTESLKYPKDNFWKQMVDPLKYFVFFLFISTNAFSYFDYQATKIKEMNGIKFDAYKDFPTKWKLVTVRLREDTNELRFTYANNLALKSLQNFKTTYPDGAIFGKVSYVIEPDPVFPSSKVPSGKKRYQIMIKDSKRFAQSKGWGYALYNDQGTIFPEDQKEMTDSCVACHSLVADRDYVFSRLLDAKPTAAHAIHNRVEFKALNTSTLPENIRIYLGVQDSIESLEGGIKKYAFSGTLDEVIPSLLDRTKLTGKSSALYIDKGNYSLVLVQADKKCLEGQARQHRIVIAFKGSIVRDVEYCEK